MRKSFFLISFCIVIACCLTPSQRVASQQSDPSATYPEVISTSLPFVNTTFQFNSNITNLTLTRSFQISEFRDVTLADVFIQQSAQLVNSVTIFAQLNGQNATNTFIESNFADQRNILFILDAQAMIIPKSDNKLTFFISVSFKDRAIWDFTSHQEYSLRFNAITIKTVYQQHVPSNIQLNQSNSQFTALLFDSSNQIATQGFFNNIGSPFFIYEVDFYIILPKDIMTNYFLNFTINYNYQLDVYSLGIDQFSLQTSAISSTNATYTFRFVDTGVSSSVVEGVFKFTPKTAGIYNFNIAGQFFLTNSFKLFPGGPEMDFFLFINATIIIPLLFLSRLIYRRLFY